MKVVSVLWKIPVVAIAVILGLGGANQVAWSGADLVLNSPLMGGIEEEVTWLYLLFGSAAACGAVWGVNRLAKPVLWVLIPAMAYMAIVPGIWNGIASGFDSTRGQALLHSYANAYALEHMTPRGLYRSCYDERIELTEDGKAYCMRALSVGPGERIPGSEHRCGDFWSTLIGIVCFDLAPSR